LDGGRPTVTNSTEYSEGDSATQRINTDFVNISQSKKDCQLKYLACRAGRCCECSRLDSLATTRAIYRLIEEL